jgi:hypothetical protein
MDFWSATTVKRELSSETCLAVPNRTVPIFWLFPVRAEREMHDDNWTKKADKRTRRFDTQIYVRRSRQVNIYGNGETGLAKKLHNNYNNK